MSNDSKKPTCVCKHPDARRCLLAMYPEIRPQGDAEPHYFLSRLFEDEQCECACHYPDEDGDTDWDALVPF